jgi:TP901-1 family phage major tail protein
MKKIFDLQMFADGEGATTTTTATKTAVSGKKLVYLYRILDNAATADGATIAFTTENTRTKSVESESTETKDGPIITPGATEGEISCTSLLAKDDTLIDALEDAMDNHKIIEVWEANLEQPVTGGTATNKFKGRYFQTTLTEMEKTSSAEDYVEVSLTFAINGTGVKGDVTVTADQQAAAAYVFADTQKTGA